MAIMISEIVSAQNRLMKPAGHSTIDITIAVSRLEMIQSLAAVG